MADPGLTVAHAAWELARALPQLDAVAWIDALGHARHTSAHKLIAHAHAHRGEPGSIRAGITLHLCDPRAESPPESHVRVHLHWAGFPSLVPQYQVIVDGVFLARVDLAWPALKIAIEYDGQWHGDGDQLTADRRRYRDLNRAGWFVYPITRADMRDVAALLVDIARVFNARAGALDRSRVRAGWTPGRSAAT